MTISNNAPWYGKRWGKKWDGKEEYVLLAEMEKIDGFRWNIFYRPHSEGSEWCNFKICAIGRGYGRMNYKLGWNGKRFAYGGDKEDMQEKRPLLYSEVCKTLRRMGYLG